jgi:hypothetical protein
LIVVLNHDFLYAHSFFRCWRYFVDCCMVSFFCMPILQHNHHRRQDCILSPPREMPMRSHISINSKGSPSHCTDATSGCPPHHLVPPPAFPAYPAVHPPCHTMCHHCHRRPRRHSHLQSQRWTIPHGFWSICMQGGLCCKCQHCGASNATAALAKVIVVLVAPPGETIERQRPCCHL